jgi:(1->4)-alpha-D-glucan 1-alpha-D-glucosylmutase
LKIASPGAPDFYQGSELWFLALVDPDNRQPVDFELRLRLFDELQAAVAAKPRPELLAELLARRSDGTIKLFATWQALLARRQRPELFTTGEYLPLEARGQHSDRVIAVARRQGRDIAIAVVPRLGVKLCGLGGGPPLGELWGDTEVVLPVARHSETGARDGVAGYEVAGYGALVDCFSGRQYSAAVETIRVAELLSQFPAALLVTAGG